MSFERKVEHFLEYSGWSYEFDGIAWGWSKGGRSYAMEEAFILQLKEHYETHGDLSRAYETIARSKP